jgi:predicted DCC family thiol-disulfide oxidoreductase YuxK
MPIMSGASVSSEFHSLLAIPLLRGFLVSLLALALVCVLTNIFRTVGFGPVRRAMRRLAALLLRLRLFRVPFHAAQRKLNILRIAAGLVLLHRTAHSALFILPDDVSITVKVVCIAMLGAAAAFTVGLGTPVAALLILFFNLLVVDPALRTSTLGSDVLAMLMLVFAIVPAGTVFSVDALVMRRQAPGAGIIRAIYRFTGVPSLMRIVVASSMALFSYALLCIYSVLMHVHEPLWLNGDAAIYLMTNNFMSRAPEFFTVLFAKSLFWSDLARLSMIGMVAWYAYFLPFILAGGWLRRFTIFWTIAFFLFSLFILQLQWLAYYEFVLLALWFWNGHFLRASWGLEIFYDDRCNLCDRTIRLLRSLDIFRILSFRPLSAHGDLIVRLGLSPEAVLRDLYGLDRRRGRLFSGYGFYTELASRVFLLAWLVPLAWVGRLTKIGPALYRVIADRRIRWFGVCMRAEDHNHPSRSVLEFTLQPRRVAQAWFAAFFTLYAALATASILVLPYSPLPAPRLMRHVAHVFSIGEIDVFNSRDLNMATHWFTLERVRGDGGVELVPITAADGTRLDWHRSDTVYFGNTLWWRRLKTAEGPVCFLSGDELFIRQQIGWTARRYGEAAGYRLSYYYQPLPVLARDPPFLRLEPARKVCTLLVNRSGRPVVHDSRPEAGRQRARA